MHTGDYGTLDGDGYLRSALFMLLPLKSDAEYDIVQSLVESRCAANLMVDELIRKHTYTAFRMSSFEEERTCSLFKLRTS